MASDTSNVPALSIDFKQNRIRVHKKTLRLLGSPDYVQLLVNPADGVIALRRLEQPEPQHFKVNWDGLLKRNSFDVIIEEADDGFCTGRICHDIVN